jgi:hypothetical protein
LGCFCNPKDFSANQPNQRTGAGCCYAKTNPSSWIGMSNSEPSAYQGPRGLGYVVAVVLGFGVLILGLSSWRQELANDPSLKPTADREAEPSTGESRSAAISQAQIDAINPGMRIKQVLEVLGPGQQVSETKTSAHTYTIFTWGNSLAGPSVSITFMDGIVSEVIATPKASDLTPASS